MMKKELLALTLSAFVALLASGCSDKGGVTGESPDANMGSATLINRAEIMAALSAEGESDSQKSLSPAALCLASSTFAVGKGFGFDIRKNDGSLEANISPAVIVSTINAVISDVPGVMRGTGCGAGTQSFIVTADEELPMDIEASDDAASSHPVDSAPASATPYAKDCTVFAHFETQGGEGCADISEDAEAEGESEAVEEDADSDGDEEGCSPDSGARSIKLVVDGVSCTDVELE